eukprot:6383826-Prymnesium_polylepis.3
MRGRVAPTTDGEVPLRLWQMSILRYSARSTAPHAGPIRAAVELRARRTGPLFVDIARDRAHDDRLAGHSDNNTSSGTSQEISGRLRAMATYDSRGEHLAAAWRGQ